MSLSYRFTIAVKAIFSALGIQPWEASTQGEGSSPRQSFDTASDVEMGPINPPAEQVPRESEQQTTPTDPNSEQGLDNTLPTDTSTPANNESIYFGEPLASIRALWTSLQRIKESLGSPHTWWKHLQEATTTTNNLLTILAFAAVVAFGIVSWKYSYWTGLKDYLEHCEQLRAANMSLPDSCRQMLAQPLPLPPNKQ